MLGNLLKTRSGRRIVVAIVVAILIISGLAVYLLSLPSKQTKSSTTAPGNAEVSGYPEVVNMSVSANQSFPLTFLVTDRYVQGITVTVDSQSPVTNATAYFMAQGTNWNIIDGGKGIESTLGEMPVGFRDTNITLKITGNDNASGHIDFHEAAAVGTITPSFVSVNITSYHQAPVPKPKKPSISFTNLPATVRVRSGTSGSYVINYTEKNSPGPLSWATNESWVSITTINSTSAVANYIAPNVTANTTYVVSINVSSANGAANSSALTVIDYITSAVSVKSYIMLDNLPATLTVYSGSKGTFTINYTALNATAPLVWSANRTWVMVSTNNGTTAFANYTAPNVTANTTAIVNISVISSNGITNSSTITFNIISEKISPAPAGKIIFENLPATITVPSGSTGTYVINYTAVNTTGSINWTASVPWVEMVPVNATLTDANYTAPVVTPGPLSILNLTELFSFNRTFVVTITAISSNGIENSSTLTFIVTAVNTTIPRPNYLIYTSICLNNSELNAEINGGIHIDINTAAPPPPSGQPLIYMIYTLICLNDSELSIKVNGGIHIDLNAPPPNSELIVYTVITANNSEINLRINGGISFGTHAPPPPPPGLSIVSFTSISSINSEINLEISGLQQTSQQPAGTASAGTDNTTVRIVAYTSVYLNDSEASVRINGGLNIGLDTGTSPMNETAPLATIIQMNNSSLEISVSGGVALNAHPQPPMPPAPTVQIGTFLFLNNSEMKVSIQGGFSVNAAAQPPPSSQPATYTVYTLICLNDSELSIKVNGGIHVLLDAQTTSVTTVICISDGTFSYSTNNRNGNEQSRINGTGNAGAGSEGAGEAVTYSNTTVLPSVKIKLMINRHTEYATGLLYVTAHNPSQTGNGTGTSGMFDMSYDGFGAHIPMSSLALVFINPTGPPT
ncbi:MAG: hypothetical protein KIY10_06855 [Thermoplasmata archaeon]|nr:hypothetical protein [Candidatus Sysuiplasma jiujiangense]